MHDYMQLNTQPRTIFFKLPHNSTFTRKPNRTAISRLRTLCPRLVTCAPAPAPIPPRNRTLRMMMTPRPALLPGSARVRRNQTIIQTPKKKRHCHRSHQVHQHGRPGSQRPHGLLGPGDQEGVVAASLRAPPPPPRAFECLFSKTLLPNTAHHRCPPHPRNSRC